ncbi:MAG: hypothetical protein MZV63_60595 [Marinilabiliales bacterium]|nr:hypothetical protein [Marinilabiliales bacterium]
MWELTLLSQGNDSTAIRFASDNMHFTHRSKHAVNNGDLYATDFAGDVFRGTYRFNSELSDKIYQVEAPDAIEPAGKGAVTAFRYSQNNTSAGTMYKGNYRNVILGFPFETILSGSERDELMRQIIEFLSK